MTWTMIHCDFPSFEDAEAAKQYMQEKRAQQAAKEAEREQFITTEQRDGFWIATLAGDWRQGTGITQERAIGDLWLMYSHEIIEKIQHGGQNGEA
jgi:hypothetical protein